MKLTWKDANVTTPAAIEAHNNMVETLSRWRHAGLVTESDPKEKMPEKIDPPKRVIACKCGNDDLSDFTLISLSDVGINAFRRYNAQGLIEAEYCETDFMAAAVGLRFGLMRVSAQPYVSSDGTESPKYDTLYLLSCDKCKETEDIWSNELRPFIDWC